MADAAVGFVVEKLRNLIVQEAINLYGVSDQVEWLARELQRMQCFLKDADAKKNKGDDERVKNWVREIRDLAFEAEDIIDAYMDLKLRGEPTDGCIGFIKRCVFILDELIARHKVHVDVEGIKTKLHELSTSRDLYGITNIGEIIFRQDVIPILPQLKDEINMVGFDNEKEKIVQKMVDISNRHRSVISIVGMGGLGKTTLAKSVYNTPEVKRSFDIFAWVIISQAYTIPDILKKISSKISVSSSTDYTIEDLSIAISKKLEEGKYLVVLDDVWEKKVWDELQKVFPDISNGSRVIITTRSLNVIDVADPTIQPHELRLLNEKESWELFLCKVFPKQDIESCCQKNLVDSAHQLIKRCRGLPLALVVLGGLVSTKPKTKDAWEKVVESMKWQFVEGGERCLEILALSYNDLPYYLKSCFLYFSCFREDMDIDAKKLIRLWAAEDFLPTKSNKTTEEIGMDCLEELAQRSMIQVTDKRYDDSARTCRIHDLLRDMCISEAKENRYLEIYKNNTVESETMSNTARRLIVFGATETSNYANSKLRCLLFYENSYCFDFKSWKGQLSEFKLLRVLSLEFLSMQEFPNEIKSLIHLRYLELHGHNLKEVPSCIGHLRNFQTFCIRSDSFKKISDSLWRIDNIRHNDLSTSIAPPSNMGNIVLKNLQTLISATAGPWIETMLPKLTNLIELDIGSLMANHANALSSSLQNLGRLASLTLAGGEIPWDNIITALSRQHCLKELSVTGEFCKQLPCIDVFPQQLVKLVLIYSNLEQDPMATLEKLPCLKYLKLQQNSYIGKQMICSATGFPQLLSLVMFLIPNLEEWKIEENSMPRLEFLCLSSCRMLKTIPEGLKNVLLNKLVFAAMGTKLTTRIKKNTGEDWYKIQHVPRISIFVDE